MVKTVNDNVKTNLIIATFYNHA